MKTQHAFLQHISIYMLITFIALLGCTKDAIQSSKVNEDNVIFRSCVRGSVTGENLALNVWDEEWEGECDHFNTTTGELNLLVDEGCAPWQIPSCDQFTNVICYTIDIGYLLDLEAEYDESEQDDIFDAFYSEAMELGEELSCTSGFGNHKWLMDVFFYVDIIVGEESSYILLMAAKFGCCRQN